jgi:dihydroorotate dehydrogenase electron transfer subunit
MQMPVIAPELRPRQYLAIHMSSSHQNTVYVEEARILEFQSYPGEQFVLRLHAPQCAAAAKPGSFTHIQCDSALPMRRPFSIMRASESQGWIEILFKQVGTGTQYLANRRPGEHISVIGPIGKPFELHAQHPNCLLLGGGVGIPPMIFLADLLRYDRQWQPLVFMGSEAPFPFPTRPSQILVPGIPPEVIAAMPLLEDWGIASRLASLKGYAGCHDGYVTDLAKRWLGRQSAQHRRQVEIFACGPLPMLRAAAKLAREFDLPCQVSLEEYMACGVGGCAGCIVKVRTRHGPAMKRVCVDGPVFKASQVF